MRPWQIVLLPCAVMAVVSLIAVLAYTPGEKTFDQQYSEWANQACMQRNGVQELPGYKSVVCKDGVVMHWSGP